MVNSQTRLLVLVLFLTAALVGAGAIYASSVTVRVGSEVLASGTVAEVPITLEGSPGITAMHLELTYGPEMLAVESVEPGDLVAGNALTAFNTDEPGRIVISVAAADEIAGDGTLAVASFLVSGEKGQATTLDLEYPQAWDGDGFEVAVELVPGHLTVGSSGLPLWLLAALALVLIVIVVVMLARRGRRKKPATPAYVEPVPQQPAAPPPRQPSSAEQPRGRKFCGDCGQPLVPGKKFCIHCGQPVDG